MTVHRFALTLPRKAADRAPHAKAIVVRAALRLTPNEEWNIAHHKATEPVCTIRVTGFTRGTLTDFAGYDVARQCGHHTTVAHKADLIRRFTTAKDRWDQPDDDLVQRDWPVMGVQAALCTYVLIDQARVLVHGAGTDGRGYGTGRPLRDEPEGVDDTTLERFARDAEAKRTSPRELMLQQARRESIATKELARRAASRGVDLTDELAAIRAANHAMQAKISEGEGASDAA